MLLKKSYLEREAIKNLYLAAVAIATKTFQNRR